MKIAIVTTADYPHVGGLSTHIHYLVAHLRRASHNVEIYSANRLSRLERMIVRLIAHFVRPLGRGFGVWIRSLLIASILARKIGNRSPVDIVHAQDVPSALVSARRHAIVLLTVHADITNFLTSEGVIQRGSVSWRLFLWSERHAYRAVTAIVAVDSRLSRHVVHESRSKTRQPVDRIYNFVDVAGFANSVESARHSLLRERLGLSTGSRVLLTTRRLEAKNGVEVAIRTVAELFSSYDLRDVVLVVAGSGTLMGELRALSRELCVPQHVRFVGSVPLDELAAYYAMSDIVMVPSITVSGVQEATSLSAIEAMASGTCVLASAIGGLVEVVEHGSTGYLFPEGDHIEAASLAASALGSPGLRAAIGSAARESAMAKFDWRVSGRAYEEKYHMLLKEGSV